MSTAASADVVDPDMVRRETKNGTDYMVIPTVAQREGVYVYPGGRGGAAYEYLPGEELTANVAEWDGVPVVLEHPTVGGDTTTVDAPGADPTVVGKWVDDGRSTDTALKGELWVRENAIRNHGGRLQEYVQGIENGAVGEVSTGYVPQTIERSRGTYNGQSYDAIQRDLVPDHVALLPDSTGNCSVQDGCGAGRYNLRANAATPYDQSADNSFMSRENASKPLYLMDRAERQMRLNDACKAKRTNRDAGQSDRGTTPSAMYLSDDDSPAPVVRGTDARGNSRDSDDVDPERVPCGRPDRDTSRPDLSSDVSPPERNIEKVSPDEAADRANDSADGDGEIGGTAATGMADRVRGNDGEQDDGYTRTIITTELSEEDRAERERNRERLQERRSTESDRTTSAASGMVDRTNARRGGCGCGGEH